MSRKEDDLARGLVRPAALRGVAVSVTAGPRGVRAVDLLRGAARGLRRGRDPRARDALERALEELEAYFRGELRRFTTPIDLEGRGSELDRRVWGLIGAIPYGRLETYGELARRLGRPRSARAVGGAVGRNPVPLIVPCHRVVGAGGRLTGFSSGLDLKVLLLELEGCTLDLSRGGSAADGIVLAADR
ncbi:MAG: methylated-DNA--[protein]-cysteine S-methyltransferase [Planctomycetes bacterium]|nr:methylated-DNA--[protein]-cysteine S-methyltransferase [Planctomycetota bacterium]